MEGAIKYIDIMERFVTNTWQEIEQYDQLGIPLQLTYNYKKTTYPISEIKDVRPYNGSKIECIWYFDNGYNTVAYGDSEDEFIRFNDLKNGIIESE